MRANAKNLIDQNIANRLFVLRKSKNFSQREIGNILKVSAQQVQKIENCENKLSHRQAYLIIEHFGLSPDYFYRV